MVWGRRLKYLSGCLACIFSGVVFAMQPFLTQDPYPTPYQNWELYLYSMVTKTNPGTLLQAPAFTLQWGSTPTTEFDLVAPLASYFPTDDNQQAVGVGDVQLAIKYLLIKETEDRPQIAFAPAFLIPTGDEEKNLGNGGVQLQLPLAIGKIWGDWTTYAGGGMTLNATSKGHDFPFGGVAVQRNFGDQLMLGAEIYTQGTMNDLTKGFAAINVGAGYNFTKNFSLLASVGYSIKGQSNLLNFVGLYYTW